MLFGVSTGGVSVAFPSPTSRKNPVMDFGRRIAGKRFVTGFFTDWVSISFSIGSISDHPEEECIQHQKNNRNNTETSEDEPVQLHDLGDPEPCHHCSDDRHRKDRNNDHLQNEEGEVK